MTHGTPVATATRILVVEDEPDIATLIKHALERQGDMRVDIVSTGDGALQAVAAQPPDLVILDLNLPTLSGTEVCRILPTMVSIWRPAAPSLARSRPT